MSAFTDEQWARMDDLLRDPDGEDCERFSSWFGRALMERVSELEAASPPKQEEGAVETFDLESVREAVAEGDGMWATCSGCHEGEDGYSAGGYPFSKAFGCKLGSGCGECGGIGAIWDTTDYDALINPAPPPSDQARREEALEELARELAEERMSASEAAHNECGTTVYDGSLDDFLPDARDFVRRCALAKADQIVGGLGGEKGAQSQPCAEPGPNSTSSPDQPFSGGGEG